MRALAPLLVLSAAALLTLGACPSHGLSPLRGDGPEIAALLQEPLAPTPATSPVAAARRLYQALVQGDTEVSWALLDTKTRGALDSRGALIGTSGRELLDASTLPSADGAVLKVRFERVLFCDDIRALDLPSPPAPTARQAEVVAVCGEHVSTPLTFVRAEDGWKLSRPALSAAPTPPNS